MSYNMGELNTSNEEYSEKIELSLGLSLNGKFGVEKSDKNKLMKSLSINIAQASLPIVRDDSITLSPPFSHPNFRRTYSVPTKIKEDGRKRKELQRRMEDGSKRKELQTLRRMEAKLRQSEKQRNLRTDKDGGSGCLEPTSDEKCEIESILKGKTVRNKYIEPVNRVNSSVMPPLHAGAKGKGKENYMGGSGDGMQWFGRRSSLGSIESAMEELMESKSLQGISSCGEASYASFQSMETDSGTSQNQEREAMLNAMKEMPRVFTKRDLPNGRQVEGILYQYGNGDKIIIMCICHGSFLNPAEFVKHAGGGAVVNPLKHIVVRPNASFFSQMKS